MAGYSLRIKPSAASELDAIDSKRERQRIVTRLAKLADDPRPPGCEKLTGPAAPFRIRQGRYRVICAVDDHERSIDIAKVGHRREVYRRKARLRVLHQRINQYML